MKRFKAKQLNSKTPRPCNICKDVQYLVEHHIRGRNIPDANCQYNLCYVCSNCHMKIHKGDIIVEDWIQTTEGRQLQWHKKGEDSLTGRDAEVYLF